MTDSGTIDLHLHTTASDGEHSPEELLAIEVYPRSQNVPLQYATPWVDCGVVLVWTKYLQ